MIESIKFGDVFRYKEKEYVFLAKTEEIVYTGQILNQGQTNEINSLYEKKVRKNDTQRYKDRLIYCYVILSTEELKNRMAHFAKTGKDGINEIFDKIGYTLNREDLQEIKKEILNPNSPVPLELKGLVADINPEQ